MRSRILALLTTLLAVVLTAGLLPSTAHAASRTIVVSPSGSDAAAGTLASPWRSVAKALRSARAGDTVVLRGGTYTEQVGGPRGGGFLPLAPGRPDARITVTAHAGERPVIAGLLWVTDPDYWTFDGVNVTWSAANTASDHMVRIRNGRGWVFENGDVWGARSYANLNILSNAAGLPADWTVRGNCVHDNLGDPAHGKAKDQLLYVNTGVDAGRGTIERNLLFGAPRGKGIKLTGPRAGTGSADVTVRYNTVVDTYKPSVVVGWATEGSQIYRNLLASTQDQALIRGYQLAGTGNRAWDNAGYAGPRMIRSDPGYGSGVEDGGGNVMVDPRFDRTGTCSGYVPTASGARPYGHAAP